MLPVLETLLCHAESGDEKATVSFGRNTVNPAYNQAFGKIPMYGQTQLVDTRDPTNDGPISLPTLVEHAKSHCVSAFATTNLPEEDKAAYEAGVNGARSFIDRIRNIVVEHEAAVQT